MAGGFDAGEALRAGLSDRQQAWDFIRRFAAGWTEPLEADDGVGEAELRAAEQCIGAALPAALREAYLLLPAELITMVESACEHMALPEYPLWAEPCITVRWFSAPGKLLRMDGRGPYCWLSVRGRTQADLESICATIPGPWCLAEGTALES